MASTNPYPLPDGVNRDLRQVLNYWSNLKRGGNSVPFWNDVNLSALPGLAERLILLDVFAHPERFRFNYVGKQLSESAGESPVAKFADSIKLAGPFAFLLSHSSATVEACAPTFYAHDPTEDPGEGFSASYYRCGGTATSACCLVSSLGADA
jgi:hypothetical protein